jgi:hypothetical protein
MTIELSKRKIFFLALVTSPRLDLRGPPGEVTPGPTQSRYKIQIFYSNISFSEIIKS